MIEYLETGFLESRMRHSTALISALYLLSSTAWATCNYTDADIHNGWGWNPIERLSCPPVTAQPCVDSDGDGWGWDGVSSCLVDSDAPLQSSGVQRLIASGSPFIRSINGNSEVLAFSVGDELGFPNDNDNRSDVFLLQRDTGNILLLTDEQRIQDNNSFQFNDISLDARFVVVDTRDGLYLLDREDNQTYDVALRNPNDNHLGIGNALISNDGEYIAFSGARSYFVSNDFNNTTDIFLYKFSDRSITKVSRGLNGTGSNARSLLQDMSPDGRYVLYSSWASNITDDQTTEDGYRLFVYDVVADETTYIPASSLAIANAGISDDGRTVAYNGYDGVAEVIDLDTGNLIFETTEAGFSDLSPDGRFFSFTSTSSEFLAQSGSTESRRHLFFWDAQTDAVTHVSRTVDGFPLRGAVSITTITKDSSSLLFLSDADNLTIGKDSRKLEMFFYDLPE